MIFCSFGNIESMISNMIEDLLNTLVDSALNSVFGCLNTLVDGILNEIMGEVLVLLIASWVPLNQLLASLVVLVTSLVRQSMQY